MQRRSLLLPAGLAAFAFAAPRLIRLHGPAPAFEPMPALPGFRRLAGGAVSGGNPALAGLDRPEAAEAARLEAAAADPCRAAFGAAAGDGRVPLAVFSDFYCPNCPELSRTVWSLAEEGAPVRLVWHEMPVLGPRSAAAARLAIAADMQGRYEAVHHRLMRGSLRPGTRALEDLARDMQLDPQQVARDIASPATAARIAESKAAAALFGLPGTPSMIVGRTVVAGGLPKQSLRELIEIEQNSPPDTRICG